MFCTNCGVKLDDNALFCHNCGTSVVKNTKSENAEYTECTADDAVQAEFVGTEASGDFIDDDVEALIGAEKRDFYINRFAEMKQKNKKTSWNWCAFLFGPAWMIYRKMYIYGGLYWLMSILVFNKLGYFDFIISILAGVFGNWLYMICVEKLAVDAKALQEPQKTEFIKNNGGTSATAVLVGMGVMFTLSFVGNMLVGGLF